MMYELFYSTGGHGGPYGSIEEALDRAQVLIKREAEVWIKVCPYSAQHPGGYGKPTAIVSKRRESTEVTCVTRY